MRDCIVLMPMLAGYEEIRDTVAKAIADAGLQMKRLELGLTDPEWQWWLLANLPSAACALVDITDHNPFVMYELGLTHSRRLPTLLIVDARNERVPATVLGTPFVPYDGTRLGSYRQTLASWLALVAETSAHGSFNATATRTFELDESYLLASRLLDRFSQDVGLPVEAVTRDEFETRLMVAEGRGEAWPRSGHPRLLAFQLLPRIVRAADEVRIMAALVEWATRPDRFARQPFQA